MQAFSERLLGRKISKPDSGVIEMVYIGPDETSRRQDSVVPIVVVRLDTTGELVSYYINKVEVVEG